MGTRLTLTSRVREYIDETDSDNSHFTDDQIYSFLNQAIRFMGTDLEWPLQTAQATAVADQAVYTLPEDFISLSDVYFNDQPLIVIERADLPFLRSDWQNAESGVPTHCYKSDNAKFGVWPPVSSDNTADGELIQIQYIKLPPDLSDDATAPDLHTAFQDCLPYYAAAICEKSMGNLKAKDSNMADYEYHKKILKSKLQRFADASFRFRWGGNY